jgi:uncharacterized protein (TIGR00290 family)
MGRRRVLLSWSSGKDSAWALHELRASADYEVVALLTTVNEAYDRVAMHGVRATLLRDQAEAAGLPVHEVALPWPCSNEDYEARMAEALENARAEGIDAVAFGDLFLEDIRRYREDKMAGTGLGCIFPLWGRDTAELALTMIEAGLRARLVCVDTRKVDASLSGRDFDHGLLAELGPGIDPCGERGEFHTFAYAGPMFRTPLSVATGARVALDGYVYCDLISA